MTFGALLSVAVLAAIYGIDCLAGHPSGMRVLYILPIWVATRLSGFGIANGMVLVITALLTMLESLQGDLNRNQVIGNAIIRYGSLFLVSYLIWHVEQRLETVKGQAERDSLTGTHNRAALAEIFERAVGLSREANHGLVLAMIDCDNFKNINDRFGHAFGDKVLQSLVQDIRVTTKPIGTIVRTGGDEFLVIFEGIEVDEATRILDRTRMRFENTSEEMGCRTSLSFGAARYGMHGFTLKELMHSADQDLYSRKNCKQQRAVV